MHPACDSKTRKMATNTGLNWSKKPGKENQILLLCGKEWEETSWSVAFDIKKNFKMCFYQSFPTI